jgi:hypothetical protein
MSEAIRARYLGPKWDPEKDSMPDNMPFIPGIPARNLTESEFDALDEGQQEAVRGASSVYEVRSAAEMHPARSASKKPKRAARTLDPEAPSEVSAGAINDPEAHAAALESGTLTPLDAAGEGS